MNKRKKVAWHKHLVAAKKRAERTKAARSTSGAPSSVATKSTSRS